MFQNYQEGDNCKYCSLEAMVKLNIEPYNQGAFQVYCEYFHLHDRQSSKDDFEELYRGEFNSEAEFSKDLYSECDYPYNALSEMLKGCIEWQYVWDNIVQYDYIFEQGYVFRGF
jgi:antirestriction protein